jgi:RNA polymerase sigma-70 factor (ECF subfamily)
LTKDKPNFVKWVKLYHGALYRHALWMIGDPEMAADLVQETCYQAWKSRKGLRDGEKAFAWFLTILRRNVYREYGYRASAPESIAAAALDAICSPAYDDHDVLIDLSRALNTISVSQRELLLLYGLHGFSYHEISRQLDIPLGTVMSRLARARSALHLAMRDSPVPGNEGKLIPFSTNSRHKEHV